MKKKKKPNKKNTDGERTKRRRNEKWLFESRHSSFLHLKHVDTRQVEGVEIKQAAVPVAVVEVGYE